MSVEFKVEKKIQTKYRFKGNMMLPDAYETKRGFNPSDDRIWEILKPKAPAH